MVAPPQSPCYPICTMMIPQLYTGPLFIATDHAGHALKNRIVRFIENELGREVTDLGAHEYDAEDDFPDFIIPAAEQAVAEDGRVIVLGGSGNGEQIAANKVAGMRCALAHSVQTAELARQHNDANGLAIGARILSEDHALAIVKTWLTTDFLGGKYERRNEKIAQYEQKQ